MEEKSIFSNKKFVAILIATLVSLIAYIFITSTKSTNPVPYENEIELEVPKNEMELRIDELKQEKTELETLDINYEDSATQYYQLEITNRDEFIDPLLSNWRVNMYKELYSYGLQYEIEPLVVTNLNIAINPIDEAYTDFYFEWQNEEKTLVVVSYDIKKNVSVINHTDYTKDDIMNEVWLYQEGVPAIRDIVE